jgi:hypothetical protein
LKRFGDGDHTDLGAFFVNQSNFWRSDFLVDTLVFTANLFFSLFTSVAS